MKRLSFEVRAFQDKYLAAFALLLTLCFSQSAFAQFAYHVYVPQWYDKARIDSLCILPKVLNNPSLLEDGALRYDSTAISAQVFRKGYWSNLTSDTANLLTVPAFFPSNNAVLQSRAEPFIVVDSANKQFVMYCFQFSGSLVDQAYVAKNIEGPYKQVNANLTGNSKHKFCLLVDSIGNPVRPDGYYHGYTVHYNGTNKYIIHVRGLSLTGSFDSVNVAIPVGFSGTGADDLHTDAPYAMYYQGKVWMWYMATPAVSQPTYGIAMRMLLATSTNLSTFALSGTALLPSTIPGEWDYGWIGGCQVQKIGSRWMMFYNASSTRPASAGMETAPSLFGTAESTDLLNWSKSVNNPVTSLANAVTYGNIDSLNIYRPHVEYDTITGKYLVFYNTKMHQAMNDEQITYMYQDYGERKAYTNSPSKVLQSITITSTVVTGSQVRMLPGYYVVNVYGEVKDTAVGGDKTVYLQLMKSTGDTVGSGNINTNRDARVIQYNSLVIFNTSGYLQLAVYSSSTSAGMQLKNVHIQVKRFNNSKTASNVYWRTENKVDPPTLQTITDNNNVTSNTIKTDNGGYRAIVSNVDTTKGAYATWDFLKNNSRAAFIGWSNYQPSLSGRLSLGMVLNGIEYPVLRMVDTGYKARILIGDSSSNATSTLDDGYSQLQVRGSMKTTDTSSVVYATSGSSAIPVGTSLTISNTTSATGNGSFQFLTGRNPSNITQIAYIGSITSTGGAVYAGTMVFGQRTASAAYTERMRIDPFGNLGVNTTTPTSRLDITGANGYTQLRLRTTYSPTSTADTNGNTGDISWDANYIYIKTASGWKRATLTTF